MILGGDCLEVLKDISSDSVDALITDPPAGISFMGKDWDHHKGGRDQWIAWMSEVMGECLRVMKPGAHGLVWAIPRTSHWTATALENAGFEVRDVITHHFGSGFPKSLDISKAIDKAAGKEREAKPITGPDGRIYYAREGATNGWKNTSKAVQCFPDAITDEAKQWQGFGTALKPASEHWILVRKKCSEKTVAANVLKHGCGGLNIDASRIGNDTIQISKGKGFGESGIYGTGINTVTANTTHQGRFPANLIFSHQSLVYYRLRCGIHPDVKAFIEGFYGFSEVSQLQKEIRDDTIQSKERSDVLRNEVQSADEQKSLHAEAERNDLPGVSEELFSIQMQNKEWSGSVLFDDLQEQISDSTNRGTQSQVQRETHVSSSVEDIKKHQSAPNGELFPLEGGQDYNATGLCAHYDRPATKSDGGLGAQDEDRAICVGAPCGDGVETRQALEEVRVGASYQRSEGGQSGRESSDSRSVDSFEGASVDGSSVCSTGSRSSVLAVPIEQIPAEWLKFFEYSHNDDCDEQCTEGCPVKELDEQSGVSNSSNAIRKNNPSDSIGTFKTNYRETNGHTDSGRASRFFYCAKASRRERNQGVQDLLTWENADQNLAEKMAELSQLLKDISDGGTLSLSEQEWNTLWSGNNITDQSQMAIKSTTLIILKLITALKTSNVSPLYSIKESILDAIRTIEANGSNLAVAVEFFKRSAQITTNDLMAIKLNAKLALSNVLLEIRNYAKSGNVHSTVKPQKLMQYLITLITPPNGTVLDPFMGSGSTGVAAKALGFDFIGIEQNSEYLEIAQKRIR